MLPVFFDSFQLMSFNRIMFECRCPHDGKMLAEIARPPMQAMTGGQLCACGRWLVPRIDLEFDQIIRTVRCCLRIPELRGGWLRGAHPVPQVQKNH